MAKTPTKRAQRKTRKTAVTKATAVLQKNLDAGESVLVVPPKRRRGRPSNNSVQVVASASEIGRAVPAVPRHPVAAELKAFEPTLYPLPSDRKAIARYVGHALTHALTTALLTIYLLNHGAALGLFR